MLLRLLRTESYKKGIVFSFTLNVIGKTVSFVTSIVVAYYFGTRVNTDVYFYCITIVTLFSALVTSVDSSVLIPESMRLAEQKSRAEAMFFLNLFLYVYIIIGVIIAMLLLAKPVAIFLVVSKFDKTALVANFNILYMSAFLIALMIIATYLVDILTSHKFFTMPMIVSMANNIISLVFLIIFKDKLGISSLMIGLIIGYLIQIFILMYAMKALLKWDFSFNTIHIEPNTFKNICYSFFGNVVSTLSSYAPLFLLSGFGIGIIASLNYAQQVSNAFTNVITTQFSSVVGIKFNELVAKKEWNRLNEIFLSSTKLLLFLLVPISFIVSLYSYEIITILFKRGAFNQHSVNLSAVFLRYLSLLLPMFAINTIVARLFMAGQKIMQALWNQAFLNVILIILIFIGVNLFGIFGYLGALISVNIINVVFTCYILVKIFFPSIIYKDILIYFGRSLLINSILCIGACVVKTIINYDNDIINMLFGVGLYLIGLVAFSLFFDTDNEIKNAFIDLRNVISVKRA